MQRAERRRGGVVWVEWGGALLPGPRDSHFPLWVDGHLTDAACRLLRSAPCTLRRVPQRRPHPVCLGCFKALWGPSWQLKLQQSPTQGMVLGVLRSA